jgi:hypothetical protein
MRLLTRLFIFLSPLGLNAQTSFYIRPTVNMKTQQSFFGNNRASENYSEYSNNYFTFRNDRYFFDRNTINFGLNAGVEYKKKHFFEFGYSIDNSGVAVGVKAQSYMNNFQDTEGLFYNSAGSTYSQTGSSFSRISFSYSTVFYKNRNNTFNGRLLGGIGLFHNTSVNRKKNIYDVNYESHFTNGQIAGDVFITEHYSRISNYWRNSFYLNLGVGGDFYTKKNHKYLFSFDLSYLQGTRPIQIDDNFISVQDQGDALDFHYRVSSRGSGIYFTLSRRLQVYPWVRKKLN